MNSKSVASLVSSASRISSLSKRRVGCVCSVRVKVSVASALSAVASASGPILHGPKSAVLAALQSSRRAAAERQVERIQQRLAGLASIGPVDGLSASRSSSLRPLVSVALRQSKLFRPSAVSSVESVMSRSVALKAFSSASEFRVASSELKSVASVDEWRPVGDVLRNVLSQIASKKVEASTKVSSQTRQVH